MLILGRKIGQQVVIDSRITVEVLAIHGTHVQLGIRAPSSVPVHREEIHRELSAEGRTHVTPDGRQR
jgi:carbon storage regulator